MLRSFLLLLLLLVSVLALQTIPHRARGGNAWKKFLQESPAYASNQKSSSKVHWIDLPLDHFGSSNKKTFPNKYLLDDSFFKGGFCFMNMGGEGPLGNEIRKDFVYELAEKHHALIVSIEHRFYGDSVPHNDFSVPNLQFLTSQQALADVAQLIDFINAKNATTNTCKWFTFGGSYSGALSAWFRLKYPNKTMGSLSSSGVVNAILNFPQFDSAVSAAIGPKCTSVLQQITKAYENAWANGKASAVKEMIGAPPKMEEGDFFYMIADSAAMADQYGGKIDMCNTLDPFDGASDSKLMAAFANFTISHWGKQFASNCFYDTDCLINNKEQWQPTSRSWRWQKCSELAYLQTPPASNSIRSSILELPYHLKQCHAIFGENVNPRTNQTNQYYGGVHPVGSHIYFSDFSDDPWQKASIEKPFSDDSLVFNLVECDGCGHCLDFSAPKSSDPINLQNERKDFEQKMLEWLNE